MALSIIDRPKGYVLGTVGIAATASNSAGTALFTSAGHGLITGAYIYIYSALSAYNGYWYVSVIDANTFNVRSYATASNQAFINSGSVTFYKSQFTHNWNCVHLPIIYKFKSTIWPINGADTARTITTFSNRNGYTYIVASGDIKAVGVASSLEQVILSGTSVDGVYQIIEWLSDTNFVISLAYSAANVLSSGTVQYYYFNYHARVRIYAGIKTSHIWTAQKPYALILELKVIPDSNGIIKLNISEYIKTKIGILKNNLLKDTLPNNLDAWCNFYVTFAESYDDSNMYTVSTFVDTYTDDSGSFQGYAVNAELPFQTRSAGELSEYVYGGTVETRQKFLTPFVRPTLFVGKYFDISFILDDTLASSTGLQWVQRNSALSLDWISVTYGNGLFVAVASNNTSTVNGVMTSPDGINWTARPIGISNPNCVTYGNGIFVAISGNLSTNQASTSPDGITWTVRNTSIAKTWSSVVYANGLFVAVSAGGAAVNVMTSPDGITWTSRSSVLNSWTSIAFGNSLFVAVANNSVTNQVMTSPDGITWTGRAASNTNQWYGVTFGNGLFVAVSATGALNRVMTSPDGITWTTRVTPNNNNWSSVTYGNGLFVAVAFSSSGTVNQCMTSPDGITWTLMATPGADNWVAITYANNIFVAVATHRTGQEVMTLGDFTTLLVQKLYLRGVLQNTINTTVGLANNAGIFRYPLNQIGTEDRQDIYLSSSDGGLIYSEVKTIDVNSHCANQDRHLTWLNNLGGFDYWDFQARKVYGREVQKVVTQESNIFTDYPKSIGEFGQTRTGEIKRVTKRRETVKSQNLTAAQVDAIATIKDSPLVQIVESQYSQRTVLVDNQSFDIRKDGDKSWKISFVIIYTDEMPSQQL